jgi:hypothetical protein
MALDAHQMDEAGDHNEEKCEVCFEQTHSVNCSCRCGACCNGRLLIEVTLRDAEREPRITQEAGHVYEGFTGTRQMVGYILNGKDGACSQTKFCMTHETRPLPAGCSIVI